MGAGRVSPEDNGGYLIIANDKILRSTSNFASLLGINLRVKLIKTRKYIKII